MLSPCCRQIYEAIQLVVIKGRKMGIGLFCQDVDHSKSPIIFSNKFFFLRVLRIILSQGGNTGLISYVYGGFICFITCLLFTALRGKSIGYWWDGMDQLYHYELILETLMVWFDLWTFPAGKTKTELDNQ